ncbi:MAG: hypothetical protein Kow00107_04910 [Planctomycetota bacterium]
MVLNLTPLLDLLLIIVFAYQVNTWLHAAETRDVASAKVVEAERAARSLKAELDESRRRLVEITAQLERARIESEIDRKAFALAAEEAEGLKIRLAVAMEILRRLKEGSADLTPRESSELEKLLQAVTTQEADISRYLKRYNLLSSEIAMIEVDLPSDYRLLISQGEQDRIQVLISEDLTGLEERVSEVFSDLRAFPSTCAVFFRYGNVRSLRMERIRERLKSLVTTVLPEKFPGTDFIFLEEGYVKR